MSTIEEALIEDGRRSRAILARAAQFCVLRPTAIRIGEHRWEHRQGGCLYAFQVRLVFRRADAVTQVMDWGATRWWVVDYSDMVDDDDAILDRTVKTLYACFKQLIEHEVMETFCYKGEPLFDPHSKL